MRNTPGAVFPPDQVALQVEHLSKEGQFVEVGFNLHQGEVLGLYGLVGSGRSELAQCLCGASKPDQGSLRLNGERCRFTSVAAAQSRGIGYVPEDRLRDGLFLQQSLSMNVGVSANQKGDKLQFWQRQRELSRASQWISRLSIRPAQPLMRANDFSGGNKQKIVLAKLLELGPKVLLVDEPTNGVDVGAKGDIHRLIRELSAQGISVLLITSEIEEAVAVCDRVLVMRRGRLVGNLEGEEIHAQAIIRLASIGLKAFV